MCHILGITWTELQKQPAEWVEKIYRLIRVKDQAESYLQKRQSRQSSMPQYNAPTVPRPRKFGR